MGVWYLGGVILLTKSLTTGTFWTGGPDVAPHETAVTPLACMDVQRDVEAGALRRGRRVEAAADIVFLGVDGRVLVVGTLGETLGGAEGE
jgi:hypothetical protein